MTCNVFTNFKTAADFLQNLSRKIILAPCVILFLSGQVYAQTNNPANAPAATKILKDHPDSAGVKKKIDTGFVSKRFGRAAIFLGIGELTPFLYDHYVAKFSYSDISFKSIAHNLNPDSWGFDRDIFLTNQFGHPYQGSYFFNALRTNGYSFWQSVPGSFAGSYIWETAGENDSPDINDFINTGMGGAILGEMEYRFSNKIINNQAIGFKRQVSEVAGFIVDPLNGLNRILNGKWGKYSANSEIADSSKIFAQFDLGLRRIGRISSKNTGWYAAGNLQYGSAEENYNTPFSNITVDAELGKDDSSRVNIVTVYGSLAGWELHSTEKNVQLALLSANYEFIRNQQFFYGAQSIKINLYSEYDLDRNIKINTVFGFGPVVLGTAPDKYIFNGRDYDYGSGVAYSGSAGISLANRLFYNVNYRGSWLGTINGNSSHYFLAAFTNEISCRLIKGFSLAAEPGYFSLHGYFPDYPNVFRNYPYVRFSARYAVTL
jgi:hypothetical protein